MKNIQSLKKNCVQITDSLKYIPMFSFPMTILYFDTLKLTVVLVMRFTIRYTIPIVSILFKVFSVFCFLLQIREKRNQIFESTDNFDKTTSRSIKVFARAVATYCYSFCYSVIVKIWDSQISHLRNSAHHNWSTLSEAKSSCLVFAPSSFDHASIFHPLLYHHRPLGLKLKKLFLTAEKTLLFFRCWGG